VLEARRPDDFDRSFQAMVKERAHAMLVLADPRHPLTQLFAVIRTREPAWFA